MSHNLAYVINSLEVLQKVRPNNRDVIYTENPLIFERLRKNGKSLKSLSFLSQNELKILDNVAFLISTAWHQYINQFCKETCDCDLNIGDTINTYIFRLISILFYRSSQINHLLGLEKEIIIPFIDDQESLDQDSFRNLIPPVDYFSIIAKSGFFGEKVKTISISANKYNNNLFYESNVSIRPSFWKYYLLAFSVDPFWLGREIFFKLMPDTSSGAFRTGKHRRFTILTYDRNRILERAWIPMRLKHIKLFKFDTPGFKVPEDISPSNNNAFQSLFQALIIMGKEKVNKSDTGTSDLSYAIEFSARRISKFVIDYLIPLEHRVYPFMAQFANEYCNNPTVMLSNNSLNNPVPSMIGQSLSKNGVPVIVFEHGAPGLSKLQRVHTFFTDLRYWDGFVAYSEYQKKYYIRHTGDKSRNIFVKGFSHIARAGFPRLARVVSRSLINVKPGEKVILYAPTRFRYNSIRLFHEYFDIPYWEFMKDLILNVFGKISFRVLIKNHRKGLLPSRDFRDNPIDEIKLTPNIQITGTPDMKYLRFAGDILILDWLSSVFEWMITCNRPLIYLNVITGAVEDDILDMVKNAIFVIDIDDKGEWKTELMKLVNLPKSIINNLWEQKRNARNYFRDNYHIGEEKSDGKMIQWIKDTYLQYKKMIEL